MRWWHTVLDKHILVMINISVSEGPFLVDLVKSGKRGKRKGPTDQIRTVNDGWEEKDDKIYSRVVNREIIGSREGEYLHRCDKIRGRGRI